MGEAADALADAEVCRVCGRELSADPNDQPDPPLGPLCGDCYRAREFDQTLWEMEAMEREDL